ncbi:aminotransferase class IV [Sphaerimonospora thailandensis]|uniref:aminotransferase class IV n=1 Tax=Sphaerimonospora thailandensis TaxID=795644 RepID=UPI00194DB6BE|nr:aminotransferase class IV [Sphaerimonospora thailandensis]
MLPRTEIDGRPPEIDKLLAPALINYGHVTVMQVRGRSVRGLDLHLSRLDAANRELFHEPLDPDRVRGYIRHILADDVDATIRVTVFRDTTVSVMVTARPPADAATRPQGLKSVVYQRPVPHIKHTGTFGQLHYGHLAVDDGFDDALLLTTFDHVAEAGIANILCHDGTAFVWPDAPALPGITMRLLDRAGLSARQRTIRRTDLPSFAAVFVTNSRGISPVGRVDDIEIPVDPEITRQVLTLYDSVPWDPI